MVVYNNRVLPLKANELPPCSLLLTSSSPGLSLISALSGLPGVVECKGGRNSRWEGGTDPLLPSGMPQAALWQHALLIFVLSAPFRDINGTSKDINYQLTAVIARVLWDLMISLVLKKLL